MKADIHPKSHLTKVSCTCGNTFEVISTTPELSVGLCANCHPFYTGQQKFVDSAGRVDRFAQRYANAAGSLKDMAAAKAKKAKKGRLDVKINPKFVKKIELKDENEEGKGKGKKEGAAKA